MSQMLTFDFTMFFIYWKVEKLGKISELSSVILSFE